MVTLIKYGALSGGEKYNVNVMNIDGLSTDAKPTDKIDGMAIPNGSVYTEIDTGDTYMYDADTTTWYKVSIGGGGGGGTQGGIILVGETTTALIDEATTNPIIINGQSYTAKPNDAVIYGKKEFLFDGAKWHEFGDLSGLASKDIGAMTGYAKASTGSAIATTDTLNQAIGKVEKRTDVNENNISLIKHAVNTSLYFSETEPTTPNKGDYWISTTATKIYMASNNLCTGVNSNYYLNNGSTIAGRAVNNTGLIVPVEHNKSYTVSTTETQARYRIALIDTELEIGDSDTAYSGMQSEGTADTMTINSGSHNYLVINATDLSKIMCNEGTTALPFEAYYAPYWG